MWERTYQVAVVVRDLEASIAYYQNLGIGPFVEGPSAHTVERRIEGKPADDVQVKGALAQMGPIEFELLQPVAGDSIQARFLDEHGEGVIHICAYTDSLADNIEHMRSVGHEVISYGRLSDGGEFAYFDTARQGGVILELFQPGTDWT